MAGVLKADRKKSTRNVEIPVDITIANIRDLESSVKADRKKSNNILTIRDILANTELSPAIRLVAMHSLRRIFISILESGILLHKKDATSENLVEYIKWVTSQIVSFLDTLNAIMITEVGELQAATMRTIVEFVQREHMYRPSVVFGVSTYTGNYTTQ